MYKYRQTPMQPAIREAKSSHWDLTFLKPETKQNDKITFFSQVDNFIFQTQFSGVSGVSGSFRHVNVA